MHSYRRVAVLLVAAGLLAAAGCWNPSPEKYPSITFFGADYGTITSGTDGSGNTVQGTVTLTWQTRLADKVNIVATKVASGNTSIIATFKSGDTTGCTVNSQFPNSDCVKDGTLGVQPTEETVYNIQAVVGAGNCDRDKVLGNLLHPDQCNDLTADPNASLTVIDIAVAPPSSLTLSVNGSSTATVTSGSDVMADYTVTNAAAFDFGIAGTDASGNPTYTQCGAAGDTTTPCNMPALDANGNVPTSGKITVPGVTAQTVLTGESTNGADDGLGDVATGSPGGTVTISIQAASNPQITGVTIDGNDALGATPAMATSDAPVLAWTNNADATGGTLMTAPASDATTAGDCTTVPAASWTATTITWSSGTYTFSGFTQDMCLQLTATGTGAATDVKTFMVDRQVNIDTFTANTEGVMTAANMVSTGLYKFSVGSLTDTTNPPALAWTTSNAASYSLVTVPLTASDCKTQSYSAGTPVTGATGNGSFTPGSAITAATCLQLTVTHPTDNTRTAMVTFEIDP